MGMTTKRARMSLEQWIKNREMRGSVTFSIEDVYTAFPNKSQKTIQNELNRSVTHGRIVSVYRGFYVVIPVEYQLKRLIPPTYYINALMPYVGKPYYLCLLTAGAFYGAAHQRPMITQVMTVAPRVKVSKKNPDIQWVYRAEIPNSLLHRVNNQIGQLCVSSPELTAVDLVQYAHHVGGYQRAATVLSELMESVDMQKMKEVMPYTTIATIQRLGYILEFVLEETEKAEQLFVILKNHTPKYKTICMSTTHAPGKNSKSNRWHVNMNIDIEIDDL